MSCCIAFVRVVPSSSAANSLLLRQNLIYIKDLHLHGWYLNCMPTPARAHDLIYTMQPSLCTSMHLTQSCAASIQVVEFTICSASESAEASLEASHTSRPRCRHKMRKPRETVSGKVNQIAVKQCRKCGHAPMLALSMGKGVLKLARY